MYDRLINLEEYSVKRKIDTRYVLSYKQQNGKVAIVASELAEIYHIDIYLLKRK